MSANIKTIFFFVFKGEKQLDHRLDLLTKNNIKVYVNSVRVVQEQNLVKRVSYRKDESEGSKTT